MRWTSCLFLSLLIVFTGGVELLQAVSAYYNRYHTSSDRISFPYSFDVAGEEILHKLQYALPGGSRQNHAKAFASYYQSSEICNKCRKTDKLMKDLKNWMHQTASRGELGYAEEEESQETYGYSNFGKKLNKIKVRYFLEKYQKELSIHRRHSALASWKKQTNLTHYNIQKDINASLSFTAWQEKTRNYATESLTLSGLSCSQTKMIKSVRRTATAKEKSVHKKSLDISSKIEEIYSNAKVCNESKCFQYEPGLIDIFAKSRDSTELLWAWKGWRDAIGPKIRNDWIERNALDNIGAREHGYQDLGEYWRKSYHVNDFKERVNLLWMELQPLYKQLHAFVRHRLHGVYGDEVSLTGPIPGHLLGNIWAQQWGNIYDICTPYKEVEEYKINDGLKKQNFSVLRLFEVADQFYQSIGLPAMPSSFWEKSMFVRPPNRSVVCYASASNLEKTDVRVKMCSQVDKEYLYVAHHEMGHCQYFLAYNKFQPPLFQDGANHGFHEAIGDTAALSVINPTHLLKLGVIEEDKDNGEKHKKHINFLLQRALNKLAFFPYALTVDQWRWKALSGEIPSDKLNAAWWEERTNLGGIAAPVARTEEDFDPGSKYHIANKVPYIRYFLSHVIQFEFYKKMCDLSGHKGELFLCDFSGSQKAGNQFAEMLRAGSSKHWEDTYFKMTGSCKLGVGSVKKYFQPLMEWLVRENTRLGNKIGWE